MKSLPPSLDAEIARRQEVTPYVGVVRLRGRSGKIRDEEIEIALSRSPFSSWCHQLRRALVLPLSIELA